MANSSILRCPSCFNDDHSAIADRGNGFLLCKCCGSLFLKPDNQEIDKITQMMELNSAESLLKYSLPNFAEAAELFKNLITKYPEMSVVRWGYIRAKYEIKYEYDEKGHMTPIFYSGQFHDFRSDKEFLKALELAETEEIRSDYVKQANYIIEEWEFASKSLQDVDYDIFISFKDTLDSSDPNHIIKNEKDKANILPLVNYLMSRGYKVFYSPMSIPKGGYPDPFIYNAIMKSKMMIVYGSEAEYFDSTWVKNEWTRYNNLINKHMKKRGSLITVVDGVEPYHLPKTLREIQVIQKDNTFIVEVLELVKKYVDSAKEEEKVAAVDVDEEFNKAINLESEGKYEEAVEIYKMLDENFSHIDSEVRLAKLISEGKGIDRNKREAAKLFKKAAEAGSIEANLKLGICYENGDGVPRDYNQAIYYHQVAADEGNAESMYHLAEIYRTGEGNIKVDLQEAAQYYADAAKKGHAMSMHFLASMFRDGGGVNQNYDKAVEFFEKAIQAGDSTANIDLGVMYLIGQGVKEDHIKAAKYFEAGANAGNADAMYRLAVCYVHGEGVKQDEKKATEWFSKAADLGEPNSLHAMGSRYEYGDNGVTPKDTKKAVEYYKKAAEAGSINAKSTLGYIYKMGQIVEKDLDEAEKYYQEAADAGDEHSQWCLAEMYKDEDSYLYDLKLAAKYFKMAADNGNELAKSEIGQAFEFGQGVPQNYERAAHYYKLTLKENGGENDLCATSLAYFYETGKGVKQDDKEALRLYKIAANSEFGDKAAEKKIKYYEKNKRFDGISPYQDPYRDYEDEEYEENDFDDYDNNQQSYVTKSGARGVTNNYQDEDDDFEDEDFDDEEFDEYDEPGRDEYKIGNQYYQNGDRQNAFKYFKLAADKGHASACALVGLMLENGIGTRMDEKQALAYFKKGAELGNQDAIDHLQELGYDFGGGNNYGGNNYGGGYGYDDGTDDFNMGCDCYDRQDFDNAFYYFYNAAQKGHTNAMFNLGLFYEYGAGCRKSYNDAIYWYRKAASLGDQKAQQRLYELGEY